MKQEEIKMEGGNEERGRKEGRKREGRRGVREGGEMGEGGEVW